MKKSFFSIASFATQKRKKENYSSKKLAHGVMNGGACERSVSVFYFYDSRIAEKWRGEMLVATAARTAAQCRVSGFLFLSYPQSILMRFRFFSPSSAGSFDLESRGNAIIDTRERARARERDRIKVESHKKFYSFFRS
jgi:hypothetical protein